MTNIKYERAKLTRRMQHGLSLIELMIAMVLGLLVIGAAIAVFASNKATYRTSQNLSRLQESGQIAFELMARDIREAGSNPCDAGLSASSIIKDAAAATPNSADWAVAVSHPLYGFETGGPDHVAGTHVLQLLRMGDVVRSTTAELTAGSNDVSVTPALPKFEDGDAMVFCDMRVLGVFRANGDSTDAGVVSFGDGGGHNACGHFPMPNLGVCQGAETAYLFPKHSSVAALQGIRWFVDDPDDNAANGYSLYRQVNDGDPEEVIQGVTNLRFQYLTETGYQTASQLTTPELWRGVKAVKVTMSLRELERSGTGGDYITRVHESVVALRSRLL